MHPKPWRTLTVREVFRDTHWLRVTAEEVELPSGARVPAFYQVHAPPHAIAVPFLEDGRVLAVWQYKHAVRRAALGFPAGHLEEGESPLAAARRELREETGHEAAAWRALGSFVLDGNRGSGVAHAFAALGARRVTAPADDPTEELVLQPTLPEEMLDALARGDVPVASQALALLLALREARTPLQER